MNGKVTKLAKKNTGTVHFFSAVFFSAAVIFSGCASSGKSAEQGTAVKLNVYNSVEEEPFFSQNCGSFSERTLSNGIPVAVKKSSRQKNCSLALVIDSSGFARTAEKSGLEEITLELMTKGTKDYSSFYISSLEYTDETHFFTSAHADFLQYGLTFPKERIRSVVPVFAGTFKTPSLSSADFQSLIQKKAEQENGASEQSRLRVLSTLYSVLNAADGSFVPPFYTEASRIEHGDVIRCHSALVNAGRIKIVASGNFDDGDIQELFSILEENFSGIKSVPFEKKAAAEKTFSVSDFEKTEFYFSGAPFAENYACAVYPVPPPLTEEYFQYALASLFFDDILYDCSRKSGGFSGDAGTGVLLGRNNVGVISLFQISSFERLSETVKESLENGCSFDAVKQKLDFYKRVYVSSVMASELSSVQTVRQMALSFVYDKSARSYIERPYRISKITPEEVHSWIDRFFQGGMLWLYFSAE